MRAQPQRGTPVPIEVSQMASMQRAGVPQSAWTRNYLRSEDGYLVYRRGPWCVAVGSVALAIGALSVGTGAFSLGLVATPPALAIALCGLVLLLGANKILRVPPIAIDARPEGAPPNPPKWRRILPSSQIRAYELVHQPVERFLPGGVSLGRERYALVLYLKGRKRLILNRHGRRDQLASDLALLQRRAPRAMRQRTR